MTQDRFSLKDHLFNAETMAQLGAEYAAGVPGFDAGRFEADTLAGFEGRELLERLDWIADRLEDQLADDFPTMADQIEAAMPAPLDPTLRDDDFGHFIHATPGILAVRHGLEDHRERALDLLHAATQRFSMEFYIRSFLNRWPDETWARLTAWAGDDNYHVRRLVSEGTRPRLPWAKKVEIDPLSPLPLLDQLHSDPTRFVTRSVSNHLNDIAKFAPDEVVARLETWAKAGRQTPKELAWMTRHALRTMIKQGDPRAMALLGYRSDPAVKVLLLELSDPNPRIGDKITVTMTLAASRDEPVIVDYAMHFRKANGETAPKVFKVKDTVLKAGKPLTIKKTHVFKAGATTFTLYPGPQAIEVQVNGKKMGAKDFDLRPEEG